MSKNHLFLKSDNFRLVFVFFFLHLASVIQAQVTFPENGVADPRHGHYAFTNATVVKDVATTLSNATLIIKDGRITAVGPAAQPANCRR